MSCSSAEKCLIAAAMHQSSQLGAWCRRPTAGSTWHPWAVPPAPCSQPARLHTPAAAPCSGHSSVSARRRAWRAVAEEHQVPGQAAMPGPPPQQPDVVDMPPDDDEPGEFESYNQDGTDPNTALMESLPPASNVRIKSAEYVSSCVEVDKCPPPKFPEFAVIGRSNVGKSSLINMITDSKRLAHVSKEPGKTKCINHFIINNNWYLVDLPGYGYAKTASSTRDTFDKFTRHYFLKRKSLAMVYLLVDSSLPPQKIDLEYAAWLHNKQVPFSLVFTKADKRKKRQPPCRENVAAFQQVLMQEHGMAEVPVLVITSSETGLGRTPLLHLTCCLRDSFAASKLLDAAMVDWQKRQLAKGQTTATAAGKAKAGAGTKAASKPVAKRKASKPLPGDDIPLPPVWKVRASESKKAAPPPAAAASAPSEAAEPAPEQ